MARSKKSEDKPKDSASLQVSIEDFVRTRDSVVTGLANLQSAVQDLSRAYITHTNTVIGKGPGASLELLNLAVPLGGENSLFSGQINAPTPNLDAGESKKRKRAPHDKNAPKRPVTPYFLYMQTARALIAAEMAEGHSAKEVADEGTRRWNDMASEEREEWSYRYGVNFARYKEKVKAYKAGKPIPVISDSEAKALYDEQKRIGIAHDPSHDDLEQINEHLETETSDTSSSEEETPEPLKAPSPPSSRLSKRRKILKEPEKKSSPIKPAVVQETEPTMNSALDQMQKFAEKGTKKTGRRRDTKGVEQTSDVKKDIAVPIMSSPQVVNHDTQLKPRKSKKKRKSEATDA